MRDGKVKGKTNIWVDKIMSGQLAEGKQEYEDECGVSAESGCNFASLSR